MLSPHTPLHTSDSHLLDFLAQCGKVGSALLGIPTMQKEGQQEGDKQKVFVLLVGEAVFTSFGSRDEGCVF